ncbi:MAG: tetratricopeptide repeat protein, partial [bacterium]
MSKHPAKLFSFYLITIGALSLCLGLNLCAAKELSPMQEQALNYRDRGLELQRQGNLEEALSFYQKALLACPEYTVAYNDAGVILEGLGRIEEAKEMYFKAIKVDPDYVNSYSNLAIIYEGEGNYTEALNYWMKRATFGAPDDPWTEAARRRIDDITEAYPEAYSASSQQFKSRLMASEREVVSLDMNAEEAAVVSQQNLDNRTRAANYLKRAKDNFAKGQYVEALKEATYAEYLDPDDNLMIKSFIGQVRKK